MKIVLFEDDRRLARSLLPHLEQAGYDCRWEEDAESGWAAVREVKPDLILLDLNLPDQSGFEVLARLRQHGADPPVIVLTARLHGKDKVRALDLGADDYITKPFWTEELLARVRAVMRRLSQGSKRQRLVFGEVVLDISAGEVRVAGAPVHMTPTEYDLLVYLVKRPGQVAMREHLFDAVLPGEDSANEALQVHISRLRRKLGADGACIRTLRGLGYRLDGDVHAED